MRWTEAPAILAFLIAVSAQGQTSPPQSAPQTPLLPQAPASAPQLPAPAAPPAQPAFVVVLDAAHGGADTGAHLGNNVEEKGVTLTLASLLRSELQARGIAVVTTRNSDALTPPIARAEAANHAQAAACLVIHATATGSGVHLYTTSLSPGPMTRPVAWASAQSAYVTQSLKLESEIDSALAHAQIPLTLGRASVQPMDNLACPAVAVEVAPLVGGHVTKPRDLNDASYQKSIVDAMAAAIVSWQSDWKH
jgi:N-acetylmuramoyl-L-alanine amidase